jgi:hypothetical protein
MVARRMNRRRNLGDLYRAGRASAVWQASFARDGLSVRPHGSQVLAALAGVMEDDHDVVGLTVRLNTYRTIYYGTAQPTSEDQQRLAGRLGQGGFHPNPARSLMVGVIGLWRKDEPPSVPCDRVLARAGEGKMGTAFARLQDGRLSIDLSNSVPEKAFDGPKADLGPLTVVACTDDRDIPLGILDRAHYDADAYQATSGIVTLVLDGAGVDAAASADLEIQAADHTVLLAEQRYTVVADPPNVYLEQAEGVTPDENTRATVSLRAFRRGKAPGRRVSVSVIEIGGPLAPREVVTNKAGKATLSLHGGRGGTWTWLLVPWTGEAPPLPEALDPEVTEYLTLRTTPADERVAALEATWENVHHHVLRYWEAMAPCMDNWLRLGDEEHCRAYARLIRSLTSREGFNSYRYMPVTRDLTPGQRTLLHRWCAQVLGEDPPTPETTTG